MSNIILEIKSGNKRTVCEVHGKEADKYIQLAKKLGIPITDDEKKKKKLSIEYFPGTYPEFDADDELDALLSDTNQK